MRQITEYLSTKMTSKQLDELIDSNKKAEELNKLEKYWMEDVDEKDCFYKWFAEQHDYPDDKKPRIRAGKVMMWWKCYKILCMKGPMSKAEILSILGLKTTSYPKMFAEFADQCIIVPNRKIKKLEPQPVEKWKVIKARDINGGYYWDYERV